MSCPMGSHAFVCRCGTNSCTRCWYSCGCTWETRQAVVHIILLCVASCSWTLLVISLSLSTAAQPSKREKLPDDESTNIPSSFDDGNPCNKCVYEQGAPPQYTQIFSRPLAQLRAAVDRLDRPLATPSLRSSLAAIRLILLHILSTLGLPSGDDVPELTITSHRESREVIHPVPYNISSQVYGIGRVSCQEQFLGTKAGYPRYKVGFSTVSCSAAPLSDVLTVILWGIKSDTISKIITDINIEYPTVRIIIISNYIHSLLNVKNKTANSNVIFVKQDHSLEYSLKIYLNEINTPYTLLAPKLFTVTSETRLMRLIWAAEWAGIWAVGGATKSWNGKWQSSCLITKRTKGHLSYQRGYTSSIFECQLCNMVDGPIIARTKWLQVISKEWSEKSVYDPSLFLPNLFVKLNRGVPSHKFTAAVCPDVLFHITTPIVNWESDHKLDKQNRKLHTLWSTFAREQRLARLVLASKVDLRYNCENLLEINTSFNKSEENLNQENRYSPGALSCQSTELKLMLETIMQFCTTQSITCLLQSDARLILLEGNTIENLDETKEIKIQFFGRNVENYNAIVQFLQFKKSRYFSTSQHADSNGKITLSLSGHWWKIHFSITSPKEQQKIISIEVMEGLWMDTLMMTKDELPHDDNNIY